MKITAYKLNINYLIIENHLKALIYFQIAKLEYLRTLHEFMQSKSQLTQIIKSISPGNLSNYNNNINYNVLLSIMNSIIKQALIPIPISKKIAKLGSVKLIVSSTISTCMTYFKWAKFRSTKAGIRIHTKFDLKTNIPETIITTNAKEHDKLKPDKLMKDRNCIYIFDREYLDYEKLDCYSQNDKYFISRLKKNAMIDEVKDLDITYYDYKDKLMDKNVKLI